MSRIIPDQVNCDALRRLVVSVLSQLSSMGTASLLQANLAECQQAAHDKQNQVSQLSQELRTAQGAAASLAKVHAEAEEQLQQQAVMLQQVMYALL